MLLPWLAAVLASSPPPLVVIDAGHGGEQLGAVGVCGAKEKDVTLAISRELAALLDASGRARALLTRDTDEDMALERRAQIANEAGAALLVSIHANASPRPQSRGVETFFLSRRAADRRVRETVRRENNGVLSPTPKHTDPLQMILTGLRMDATHGESQRLAMRLHDSLTERVNDKGRGVLQAPFIVLMEAQVPSALVEAGFLSNAEECRLLSDTTYQRAVAQALATALLAHLASEALTLAQH